MAANDKPPFQKFAKMEEDRFSDRAKIPRKADFVVTEKIHGANFCVIIKNDAVFFAKRTAILPLDDDFYSFRSSGLAATLSGLAISVPSCLKEKFSVEIDEKDSVYIYGELCGGKYPHPDVKKKNFQPVQQGIWYCPDIQFVAFDVAVGGGTFFNEMREDAFDLKYLDFDIANGACKECGINFVPTLCRGTKNECFDFDYRFLSSIGEKVFGLPPLPHDSNAPNLAEGVVVRCCVEPVGGRAILKRKIPEFQEKRYQNDDWKKSKGGGGGGEWVCEEIPPETQAEWEMMSLITSQRVDNALSKIGRVSSTDKEKLKELLREYRLDVLASLDPSDREIVEGSQPLKDMLLKECKKAVGKRVLQIEKEEGKKGKEKEEE